MRSENITVATEVDFPFNAVRISGAVGIGNIKMLKWIETDVSDGRENVSLLLSRF